MASLFFNRSLAISDLEDFCCPDRTYFNCLEHKGALLASCLSVPVCSMLGQDRRLGNSGSLY